MYLLSEPKQMGCSRLAEILKNVSHDSINRFLLRERYEAKDLFDTIRDLIDLKGGILRVDETVIEKHYSNPGCAELIGYFWSGKYHLLYQRIESHHSLGRAIAKKIPSQLIIESMTKKRARLKTIILRKC